MESRRRRRAVTELESLRRQTEDRLGDLRRSLDRELGRWVPRGGAWAVPLVAFACGVALALATGRKKKTKTED